MTNETNKSNSESNMKNNLLAGKYSILNYYKLLNIILMIIASIGVIFSLTQELTDHIYIYIIISYILSMFSLYCVIKIINFLFDLDNKDEIIEAYSIKNIWKNTDEKAKTGSQIDSQDSIRVRDKSTGKTKLIKRSEWKEIINNKEQNMYDVIYD